MPFISPCRVLLLPFGFVGHWLIPSLYPKKPLNSWGDISEILKVICINSFAGVDLSFASAKDRLLVHSSFFELGHSEF